MLLGSFFAAVLVQAPGAAAAFEGQFGAPMHGSNVILTLRGGGGGVTGTAELGPVRGQVTAVRDGAILRGVLEVEGEQLRFVAAPTQGGLRFRFEDSEDVLFRPLAGRQTTAEVIVNGRRLSAADVEGIARAYGAAPKPGRYWYDRKSGLYGNAGEGAAGFMKPGHDWGKLARDASGGDTGVRINGRELPRGEWAQWSQLFGAPIQPGSYWIDGSGNAGTEGDPRPTANLYAAASARDRGQAGGDNFWSSRFSAGNSNADNSQGYVSVPGYGPVGYGF